MPKANNKPKRKRLSPDTWREVVALSLHGIAVTLLAKHYSVSRAAIYNKKTSLYKEIHSYKDQDSFINSFLPSDSPFIQKNANQQSSPNENEPIKEIERERPDTPTSGKFKPESAETTERHQWRRVKRLRAEITYLSSNKFKDSLSVTQRLTNARQLNTMSKELQALERQLQGLDGQETVTATQTHVIVGVAIAAPKDFDELVKRHKAGEVITVDTVQED